MISKLVAGTSTAWLECQDATWTPVSFRKTNFKNFAFGHKCSCDVPVQCKRICKNWRNACAGIEHVIFRSASEQNDYWRVLEVPLLMRDRLDCNAVGLWCAICKARFTPNQHGPCAKKKSIAWACQHLSNEICSGAAFNDQDMQTVTV